MIIETDDYRLLIPNCFRISVSQKFREITIYHKKEEELIIKICSLEKYLLVSLSPRFKIAKLNEQNVIFIHGELWINIIATKPVMIA